jgi:glutathione synthetase
LGPNTRFSHLHKTGTSLPSQGINADQSSFPPNASLEGLCSGLLAAHRIYGDPKSGHATKTGILLICQPVEWNIYEHRRIQYFLWSQNPTVPIYNLTLSSILDKTTVTDSRHLLYTPNPEADPFEISVVFFRGGHDAEDYVSATEWAARQHLERSFAIKCPSILTQISCTKKVQQLLAKDSNLKRFVSDASSLRLKKTFMEMYPLDAQTADGQKGRQLALDPKSACGYVLKPQRECGGHNIYGAAIPGFLNALPESQWRSYILMRLIEPPSLKNTTLRNGEPTTQNVVNELGVYGACIWRGTRRANNLDIIYNENAGWLVRTKNRAHAEGGIGAGFGYLDSLLLVDY